MPVLIDKHYNARALPDMVLIAENAANQDEHPTGFACDGGLLSRPLSPMRHALAATLQHLGGVLPPHLGFHPARRLVTHDWLWSVGAHPLSWTSTGTSYSQLHIDALHRSYLLDALDMAVETVNAGVALLADEAPTKGGRRRALAAAGDLRDALRLYASCVNLWRTAVSHAAALDFGAAADVIPAIEAEARAFYATCVKVRWRVMFGVAAGRCRSISISVQQGCNESEGWTQHAKHKPRTNTQDKTTQTQHVNNNMFTPTKQIENRLHPKRCAETVPLAPSLLRAIIWGSAAAVLLTAALTLGVPRRKGGKRE